MKATIKNHNLHCKNGLLFLIFGLFKHQDNFTTKDVKNYTLISGAGIRTHDLTDTSLPRNHNIGTVYIS